MNNIKSMIDLILVYFYGLWIGVQGSHTHILTVVAVGIIVGLVHSRLWEMR